MRSFGNLLTGNGEVHLPNKFLSPRLVKEALEKKFKAEKSFGDGE
jgi:hypothetical protein